MPRRTLGAVILVDVADVSMFRPDKPLFEGASVTVSTGDRLGVVGINGTGKSTLLRVIAGRQDAESGSVIFGNSVSISMLDQTDELPAGTVRDVVAADAPELWEAESVLTRLGMGDHFDRSTSGLSGGETKRVALARALVTPSDLLILDEPTNHLDLEGIEWLEQRLSEYRGGLILVTHDRHVLDRLTTRMLELDRGNVHVHEGGYDDYLENRADREAAAADAESIRQNLARSELAWLRRGAKARTSKPKYRVEAAKKLIGAKPEGPARPSELHLEFPTPRLGDVVIELSGIGAATPDGRSLFSGVDLKLDPRERLGIVGPNGAGKTTLLDIMARLREPQSGSVNWGSTIELGYFRQLGVDLDPNARAREVIAGPDRKPDWTDARLLSSFWFSDDAQWAPVSTLSGGERRRLELLTILASKPNVLLLDEPTNDLDLETLRALEDFLEDWPGAVVVVSHDRAFLERVVADALVVDGEGNATRWPGGFNAWDEQRKSSGGSGRTKQAPSTPQKVAARPKGNRQKSSGRSSSTIGHLIREAEKSIAKLGKKRDRLQSQLVEITDDHAEMTRLGQELAEVETEIVETEERWLELADEQEQAGQ